MKKHFADEEDGVFSGEVSILSFNAATLRARALHPWTLSLHGDDLLSVLSSHPMGYDVTTDVLVHLM
jgi:hypothetical protein